MSRNWQGVVSDKRKQAARKHAAQKHTCPLCQAVARGNGGWASHRRWHVRQWIKNGRSTALLGPKDVAVLERWERKFA